MGDAEGGPTPGRARVAYVGSFCVAVCGDGTKDGAAVRQHFVTALCGVFFFFFCEIVVRIFAVHKQPM